MDYFARAHFAFTLKILLLSNKEFVRKLYSMGGEHNINVGPSSKVHYNIYVKGDINDS